MLKTLFSSRIDTPTAKKLDNLGDIRFSNGKFYKYIQYSVGSGTVAGTAGAVVVGVSTDWTTTHIVTKDYSDGLSVAGVLVAAMSDLQYGWVQLTGLCTLGVTYTAVPVDGQPICIGTADGAATKANEADTAAVYKNVIGVSSKVASQEAILRIAF